MYQLYNQTKDPSTFKVFLQLGQCLTVFSLAQFQLIDHVNQDQHHNHAGSNTQEWQGHMNQQEAGYSASQYSHTQHLGCINQSGLFCSHFNFLRLSEQLEKAFADHGHLVLFHVEVCGGIVVGAFLGIVVEYTT
jgi:hypothetical protein